MQACRDCGGEVERGRRGGRRARCNTCRGKRELARAARMAARAAIGTTCQACGAEFKPRTRRGGRPKRFCSESCMAWARRHPGQTRPTLACRGCGAQLEGRRRVWCSDACWVAAEAERAREKAAARRVYPQTAACAWCDEPFEQKRAIHRFCSARCYQANYREEHPEKFPPRWAGARRKRLPKNWNRIRSLVLERDPTCQVCGDAPSSEVDHIRPGDDHRLGNLQGICAPCHKAKTQREAREAKTRCSA